MKPNYLKIKDSLNAMIDSEEFKVGERLPSEYEMARYFNVSRNTFRSAIKLLEQEGKILVKHGVGTFVTQPLIGIPSGLEKLQSVSNMISLAGLIEGEVKEKITYDQCNKEWAEKLNLKENTPIIILERIRTADERPVALTINIIPKFSVPGKLLSEKGHFKGSIFTFLEKQCNIYIVRAETEIIVPLDSDPYIKKLQVSQNTPILLLNQTHYDENNQGIFGALDYFRNDIFKFGVRRERMD